MEVLILLVSFGIVGLEAVSLSNMGSCLNIDPDPNFDLNKFAKENNGIWPFKLVPNVKQFANLEWMFLAADPIATAGVYQVTVYQQLNLQEPSVFLKDIYLDLHGGRLLSKPIYANVTVDYKIMFLWYVSKRLAYFYVCSDVGGDDATDYRYVVAHGRLTMDEKTQIKKIEEDYGFKNNLRYVASNN